MVVRLVCVPPGASAATPAELLTSFQPSISPRLVRTDYAAIEVEFSTAQTEWEPGTLAHHLPQAVKDFRFASSAIRPDLLSAGRLSRTLFGFAGYEKPTIRQAPGNNLDPRPTAEPQRL